MEQEMNDKWAAIIADLKDGKSIKVHRSTVIKGVTKPFGTLTRTGKVIEFTPAKGVRAYAASKYEDKKPQHLTDIELLNAFGF